MHVLDDGDVFDALSVTEAIATVETAFREQAAGTLFAPPRFTVDAGDGELVFTAGTARERGVTGFRVYETFPPAEGQTQLTAVWSSETGAFRGLHAGNAVAGLRTGAIGGVAVDSLSRTDATNVGVLGSGPQAQLQATAVDAVRGLERLQVYSPTPDHREAYVDDISDRVACEVTACANPEPVVREADVLIVATDSVDPVFETDWVAPGTHVSTLGPKRADAHEVPQDLLDRAAVVATDSLAQAEDEPAFFLPDPDRRLVELGACVAGNLPDRADDAVTVFCSVGLAGTEVVLADEVLERTG